MRSLAVYTALRIAVFAVVFGVLWLVFGRWVSGWAVALLALVVTGAVSLLAFRRQSAEAGAALAGIGDRARHRYQTARAAEDVDDDD